MWRGRPNNTGGVRVEPDGPIPCDLALFGECPGWEEQIEGRGFVGKSGKQLWADMLRFAGLTRDDFYISNIVKTGLPKNRNPKPAEIAAALPEFLDELERVNPLVIVTAGGFATRAALGHVPMWNVHGIPHTAEIAGHRYTVMPIYHPAAGLHNKGYLGAFAYDLKQFRRLLDGEVEPWKPSPLPARSSWLTEAAKRACGHVQGSLVGLDTEGWPDQPWGLSFSPNGTDGFVIDASDTDGLRWFTRWLKNRVVVMHNGIHDLPVLRAMGVHVAKYHDTQVIAYHDMMRTGSGVLESEAQNLGTLAYRETQMVLGELADIPGVDFETKTIPHSNAVMQYSAMDPIATYRLFKIYEQRGLVNTEAYQIDMGQVPLVEEMMRYGIPFDVDAATDYYTEVIDKFDTVTEELRAKAARLGNRDFNPGSHPQVRELLTRKIGLRIRKRTKGGLASTNEKALVDHADEPFVKKLQDYRELAKLKGTYVKPLLEELQ